MQNRTRYKIVILSGYEQEERFSLTLSPEKTSMYLKRGTYHESSID